MTRLFPRRFRWLILICILSLAVAAGIWYWRRPAGPVHITAPVVIGDIENLVLATGTVAPRKQVSVGAQVSGQLKSLKVAAGDRVSAGQLIAEIDDMAQQNSLRDAQARLDLRQAERRVAAARLEKAERVYRRERQMLAQAAGSRQDADAAEAELKQARAALAAADAEIASATIQVDAARVALGYTRIHTPIDGVVAAIVTREGQTVNAAQTAPIIVKVAQFDMMTVKTRISEADVVRVRPGMPTYFTVLGQPDRRYNTTLRAVEPAPDSFEREDNGQTASAQPEKAAIYYNGLLDIENPDGTLRISMTAQVHIVLSEAKGVPLIPSSALGARDEQGRYEVRVMDAKGRGDIRHVTIGINDNAHAQVIDGLREGEVVITGGGAASPAAGAQGQP
ncbi:Macrolide transporter subunit MacA [Bordetella sputigena]|uniref:efflux RND transporter periplasmic adaptor subunit n=1 Tax=Bordetella sputigena TaxID=1416810 RepID=UPI0039EEB867